MDSDSGSIDIDALLRDHKALREGSLSNADDKPMEVDEEKKEPEKKKSGTRKKAATKKTTTKKTTEKVAEKKEPEVVEEKTPSTPKKKGKTIEETYVKLSHREQIITRPDTYIGSVEKNEDDVWIYQKNETSESPMEGKMVKKHISFTPGLFKIYDEILVNASDNFQRDSKMTTIKVTINGDIISVYNNGKGIPIEIHKVQKIYVPELIFGELLTSSNYSDNDKKVTGGRNGYGAKLANIFSTEFKIETSDGKKVYTQEWKNNMSVKEEPVIKEKKGEQYTKVTFKPDYKRFQMEGMEEDTRNLLIRRAFDIAGCNPGKTIFIDGKKVCFKTFKDYCKMYTGEEDLVYEKVSDRWDVCVCSSHGEYQQVSFVNSINTSKGGSHVDYLMNLVTKFLLEKLKKKNKKGAEIKPFQVKNHLFIFVKSLIENPAFDSQTKETLKTQASKFGSKPELSEQFLNKLTKLSVMDDILTWAVEKGEKDLLKTGGKKTARITGIPKLDDANKAGTREGYKCTLILTEGDSAKTLAVSGLSVVGRDYYGVFPLRGKPLNVSDCSNHQIKENKELESIAKIMGLRYGKTYTSLTELRYGHVMAMADQDFDGSHIKGLLLNYFNKFWPSLLKIDGFFVEFITPIVKVKRRNVEKSFFTIPQFNEWKENEIANGTLKQWDVKYYKGLGTSKDSDAKEYFSDLNTHVIKFDYDDQANQVLDLAFNKKRADDRKDWLKTLVPNTYLNQDVESVTYNDFVHKELILFSYDDCERSIPNVMDGLKPSQRKVLWVCLVKNIIREQKVSQLSGLVSEKSSYQHGEQSLQQTIVNMAQNFCGSNNINLLLPSGQFGSRIQGGKDQAAARYIFTRLSTIARFICRKEDDQILNYLIDEDKEIEPIYYLPVIPLILCNGAEGIGTGWSTNVTNYNPKDIIENCRRYIRGEDIVEMKPWFRGWNGNVKDDGTGNYYNFGKWRRLAMDKIQITELPIKTWIEKYKKMLEKMIEDKEIKGFEEHHKVNTVDFIIDLVKPLDDVTVWNKFKLWGSIKTTNFHLFNHEQKITKYNNEKEILEEFCAVRLDAYESRKNAMLAALEKLCLKLSNKARFIKMVVDKELEIRKVRKAELNKKLTELKFDPIFEKSSAKPNKGSDSDNENEGDVSIKKEPGEEEDKGGYDYLLSMKIWSLTYEEAMRIMKELEELKKKIDNLKATSIKTLWENDLKELEEKYPKWLEEEDKLLRNGDKSVKREIVGKKGKRATKKQTKKQETISANALKTPEELAKKFGEDISVFEWKEFPPEGFDKAKRSAPTTEKATKKKASTKTDGDDTKKSTKTSKDLLDLLKKDDAKKDDVVIKMEDEDDDVAEKPKTRRTSKKTAIKEEELDEDGEKKPKTRRTSKKSTTAKEDKPKAKKTTKRKLMQEDEDEDDDFINDNIFADAESSDDIAIDEMDEDEEEEENEKRLSNVFDDDDDDNEGVINLDDDEQPVKRTRKTRKQSKDLDDSFINDDDDEY